jgi:hypothetical protein
VGYGDREWFYLYSSFSKQQTDVSSFFISPQAKDIAAVGKNMIQYAPQPRASTAENYIQTANGHPFLKVILARRRA